MNTREIKLKRLELNIKQRTLELKEKEFIVKQYKISLTMLLKIYIYPLVALLLILLFKSNELSNFGFKIIFIVTIIFSILAFISINIFIFTNEKEIAEKINNKKNFIKTKVLTILLSIIFGSLIGLFFADKLPNFLNKTIEIKHTLAQKDNKS